MRRPGQTIMKHEPATPSRLIPADAATIAELHAENPHLTVRWLEDLRTFSRVYSWKPCKRVLFSRSDVLEYASTRGTRSPSADRELVSA
jgi:hypothetical protein